MAEVTQIPANAAVKFYAAQRDYNRRIDVALYWRATNGDIWAAKQVTYSSHPEFEMCDDRLFSLRPEEAQELMDELYRCGLRPTEGAGSAGQMAAVQQHLKDMRTIAFDRLKIKL